MAKDREEKSELEQEGQRQFEGAEDEDEAAEEHAFEQPFCPRCGWHNTRPSHSSNIFDMVVRMFGVRPYRCRSCGNRFRVMRRVRKA
jgi:hypothetical protein